VPQALPEDAVHAWVVRPESLDHGRLESLVDALLSPREKARLARIRVADVRVQYAAAQVLLRRVLEHHAGVPASAWSYSFGPHGRPEVAEPREWAGRLRFNLSHTRGLVACAVTLVRDVGVDVERPARNARIEDIARRFFAPDEREAVLTAPAEVRRDVFFRYWTLKESYMKGRGLGLALPLGSFGFDASLGAARLRFTPPEDRPEAWRFAVFRPTPEHLLSIAARVEAGERLAFTTGEAEAGWFA
jgi:4'-phosphopantetheinyl transferase